MVTEGTRGGAKVQMDSWLKSYILCYGTYYKSYFLII